MKIMIAYDGSKGAESALRDLTKGGLPANAKALVFTVTNPLRPLPDDDGITARTERTTSQIHRDAQPAAKSPAEKGAETLRSLFPEWKIATETVSGDPAEGIIRRAAAWNPDLLAMGSHGRTALGRLLLGSFSQKVLHHAPCNLRFYRTPKVHRDGAPRVLVAVDGSKGSDLAVASAASRSWSKGTRVRVVSVLDEAGLSEALRKIRSTHGNPDPRARWVEMKSQSAARILSEPGISTETRVVLGDARIALLREARDWQADVIFMGSRGLPGLDRYVLGSVSSAVAAHAPCTVEVSPQRAGRPTLEAKIRLQRVRAAEFATR